MYTVAVVHTKWYLTQTPYTQYTLRKLAVFKSKTERRKKNVFNSSTHTQTNKNYLVLGCAIQLCPIYFLLRFFYSLSFSRARAPALTASVCLCRSLFIFIFFSISIAVCDARHPSGVCVREWIRWKNTAAIQTENCNCTQNPILVCSHIFVSMYT